MTGWTQQHVAVLGLDQRGQAVARLLQRRGARVAALDHRDTPALREATVELRALGLSVRLGASRLTGAPPQLAVRTPAMPADAPLVRQLVHRHVPLVSDLELAYSLSQCLHLAVAGTNGKSSTIALLEAILTQGQKTVLVGGTESSPPGALVDRSREVDYLLWHADAEDLEGTQTFRPTIAVLLNLTPAGGHLARQGLYLPSMARLFGQQQAFDWAVVQSEALAQLRAAGHPVPAKTVTFSARNRRADLYLDRGLIISQLADWSGPLWNLEEGALRGPHQAENLMAALAVGRILRVSFENMLDAIRRFRPLPHRCEWLGEVGGIGIIDDAEAENPDATRQALLSVPSKPLAEPHIWLIAGGRDPGLEYHDLGPLLAQRVKRAILLGEARERLRAAWGLFTPCTLVSSLLEALSVAAESAVAGDVILFSPACSSLDMFPDSQQRGAVFREAVGAWRIATGSRAAIADPTDSALPAPPSPAIGSNSTLNFPLPPGSPRGTPAADATTTHPSVNPTPNQHADHE